LLANNYNLGHSESYLEKMKVASVVKGEWNRKDVACSSFKIYEMQNKNGKLVSCLLTTTPLRAGYMEANLHL
jgi:hypothetical protein